MVVVNSQYAPLSRLQTSADNLFNGLILRIDDDDLADVDNDKLSDDQWRLVPVSLFDTVKSCAAVVDQENLPLLANY